MEYNLGMSFFWVEGSSCSHTVSVVWSVFVILSWGVVVGGGSAELLCSYLMDFKISPAWSLYYSEILNQFQRKNPGEH